jgi:predicted secreted protein
MRKRIKYIVIAMVTLVTFYFIQYFSIININFGKGSWWVSHHYYVNATDGTKNVYVIVKDGCLLKFKRYNISKNSSISVNIPKKSEFTLSLPANVTVAYRWERLNNPSPNIIEYLGDSYVDPPEYKIHFRQLDGESPRRQNLSFKSLDKGTDKLSLRYRHNETPQVEYNYDINLNLIVE